MARFNLIDERWIPCVMRETGEAEELSLADVFRRSAEIREIFDPSPLVTVSLHRLLLAIVHRNFGPVNLDAWANLWRAPGWDMSIVDAYFSDWHGRFDLFDAERPFYQVPAMLDEKEHAVALLAQEAASGNNDTLFDHSFRNGGSAMRPAQAARYLVARQTFSVGGGVSKPFNLSHSPLLRGLTVFVLGTNLRETLLLNTLAYAGDRPIPRMGEDMPAWEQDGSRTPDKDGSIPLGYIDYLTWQSRCVYLRPDETDTLGVRWCQLRQNLKLTDRAGYLDPFKCYRVIPEKGSIPVSFDPDQALWRDSAILFQRETLVDEGASKASLRPVIFNWLARIDGLRREGTISASPVYSFAAFGLTTDPRKAGKVLFWRHERLPLPLVYLEDEALVEKLRVALGLAESVGRVFHGATRTVAEFLVAPQSDSVGGRKPDARQVTNVFESISTERVYWARLEPYFKRLLVDLAQIRAAAPDTSDFGAEALGGWRADLRHAARDAFREMTHGLDRSARTLKAIAAGQHRFDARLKTVLGSEAGRGASPTAVVPDTEPTDGGES